MKGQPDDQYWDYKRQALAGYEAGSATYDGLYLEEQEKKYERCSRYLTADGGRLVLDCGCGTGILLARLTEWQGIFVGVDYSKAMLRLAQKRVELKRNVGLVCADADYLPFKSKVFDKIVSFTMLGNLLRLDTAIREMARVTRDSALIVLSFVKKNLRVNKVLEALEKESVSMKEFIDDAESKDWMVIGQRTSRMSASELR